MLILGSFVALPLASCGGDSGTPEKTDEEKKQEKEEAKERARLEEKKGPPICPQTAIVREIDDFKDYGQAKPDPAELVAEARLETVTGNCAYRDKDDSKGIDITFDLTINAAKGPRLGGDAISFPYFVAVVDPDGAVVAKDKMQIDFTFGKDKSKWVRQKIQSLHVFIPIEKKDWQRGPYYQVLSGFQLTKEQLEAVRASEDRSPDADGGSVKSLIDKTDNEGKGDSDVARHEQAPTAVPPPPSAP